MTKASSSSNASKSGPVQLRELRPADRDSLERILRATGVFSEEEVEVALEVLDETLELPDVPDAYRTVVAELADGKVAGYATFGSTPNLERTYDLYWIAVDPALHGKGVGRVLIQDVEATLASEGGGVVVVETSGRDDYVPTRAFYRQTGYIESHREKDHYGPGDDKVVYVKELEAS
jgi:ribosomal protein S18 acetylase RimI-like enzyme